MNQATLTKEIGLSWAIKRSSEQRDSFRNRLAPVREFAKYLNRSGEIAFVIPPYYARRGTRRLPYIYSETEITTIWQSFDALIPCSKYPVQHIVLPAIIRLLYCCGLRPGEACKLKIDDVDLKTGKLFIRESKGHKDRIVMLADDVKAFYNEYNVNICRALPSREWFFPFGDRAYTNGMLNKVYRSILAKTGIVQSGPNLPRLYDFRYQNLDKIQTFAA